MPPAARASRGWATALRWWYRVLTRIGPLVRPVIMGFGLGNIVEVRLVGRRTGRRRDVLLGMLRVGNEWYLGHPNGPVNWTRNLDAAGGEVAVVLPHRPPMHLRAVPLADGPERRRVIAATWHQHVFPGNVIYWLARRHVLAVGRYYRLGPLDPGPDDD